MKEMIKILLTNLIGLSILSLIVNMALPNGTFKRYAKLMINMVIVVIIFKIFLGSSDNGALDQSMLRNYTDTAALEYKIDSIDRAQEQQIEKLFKDKVENQIKMQVQDKVGGGDVKSTIRLGRKEDGTYAITKIHIKLANSNMISVNTESQLDEHRQRIDTLIPYLSGLYDVSHEDIIIEMDDK